MNDSFDIKPLEVKNYLLALLIGLPLIFIFTLPEILTKTYYKLGEKYMWIILPFISIFLLLFVIFMFGSLVSSRLRRYIIEKDSIIISSFLSNKIVIPFTDIKNVSFITSKDSIDPSIIAFYAKDNSKLFSLSKDDYQHEYIVKLLELLKEQNVEMSEQIEKFIRRSLLGL